MTITFATPLDEVIKNTDQAMLLEYFEKADNFDEAGDIIFRDNLNHLITHIAGGVGTFSDEEVAAIMMACNSKGTVSARVALEIAQQQFAAGNKQVGGLIVAQLMDLYAAIAHMKDIAKKIAADAMLRELAAAVKAAEADETSEGRNVH